MQMDDLSARPASRASYDVHGGSLDAIHPVNGGRCDGSGVWLQRETQYDHTLKAVAHGAGQVYMPTVWIESAESFQAILDSPALSARSIENLVELAIEREDGPWDGVDFDIETISDDYRDRLTAWFERAISALHMQGLTTNITATAAYKDAGQPGRHFLDFAALKDVADTITPMLYSSSGMDPNTAPGAYRFSQKVLEYVLGKGVPPEKVYAGLGVTSRYTGTGGLHMSYDYGQSLLEAPAFWYELGDDSRRFALKRAQWDDRGLWVVDVDTLRIHLNLVNEYGLGGACLFVLGSEDAAIWPAIKDWQVGTRPWCGYVAFENIGLFAEHWGTFREYAKVQGRSHSPYPNHITHSTHMKESIAIIEAQWREGELSIEHCKDWLGALLNIGTELVDHDLSERTFAERATPIIVFSHDGTDYLRAMFLGGLDATWEQSRAEVLAYLTTI